MSLNLNSYELNVLMRALNDHESVLSADWEKAQKARPYGARATQLTQELREVRRLADVLHAESHAVAA
jgi:hypothetical protein